MLRSTDSPPIHRHWLRYLWILIIALILAVVLFPRSTSPGGLLCGDINRDSRITAADLIWIVNYIFRGGLLPEPAELADVNSDSAVNLADVVYLINYIYKAGAEPNCPPFGIPVIVSGCKVFTADADSLYPPPNQDCLEWDYDGTGQLHIRHLNAGFNCCPDEIVVNAYVDTGLIVIEEQEFLASGEGCDCLCLFDLEYTIVNVHPDSYAIHVLEPYAQAGDDPLAAIITLDPAPDSGTFCVDRSHYPWSGATISTDSFTVCKNLVSVSTPDLFPLTSDCVEYLYDTSGILHIHRVNAGYNCCAIPGATLTVIGDTIEITEVEAFEEWGPCLCLCVFDVDFTITGLARDAYVIRIKELYVDSLDSVLEFPVDFAASATGSFCVSRSYYPWGP